MGTIAARLRKDAVSCSEEDNDTIVNVLSLVRVMIRTCIHTYIRTYIYVWILYIHTYICTYAYVCCTHYVKYVYVSVCNGNYAQKFIHTHTHVGSSVQD